MNQQSQRFSLYILKQLGAIAIALCLLMPLYAMAKGKTDPTITVKQVKAAQKAWGNSLIAIGRAYSNHKNYKAVAQKQILKNYAYNDGQGIVLFKPTLARKHPFRNNVASALSYFVNGNDNFKEDKGFALKPWVKVTFHNDEIFIHNDIAMAMGTYTFTPKKGKAITVEYTFGYIKNKAGQLKIVCQHSSLPYSD